jgi:hypothetical protein
MIAVYGENHMKPISTFHGQIAELLNFVMGGKCVDHCDLKG